MLENLKKINLKDVYLSAKTWKEIEHEMLAQS
jgi:hypothetical protein